MGTACCKGQVELLPKGGWTRRPSWRRGHKWKPPQRRLVARLALCRAVRPSTRAICTSTRAGPHPVPAGSAATASPPLRCVVVAVREGRDRLQRVWRLLLVLVGVGLHAGRRSRHVMLAWCVLRRQA